MQQKSFVVAALLSFFLGGLARIIHWLLSRAKRGGSFLWIWGFVSGVRKKPPFPQIGWRSRVASFKFAGGQLVS